MTSKLLAIAAFVLNVVLVVSLYKSKTDLSKCGDAELEAGTRVSTLIGADLAGHPLSVTYPSNMRTVLYVFSPSCGWCERNQPSVQSLARFLRGRARFLGVSLDREGLFDWTLIQKPEFDIITDLSYRAPLTYQFKSTPMTAVITPSGTVEKVWHGAYVGKTLSEIEQYFGVSLPPPSS